MTKAAQLLFRSLEFIMVFLLGGMAFMVFGNVLLRYGFNSGLNWSEEMSRYFFVWLTFIGAVVTFHEYSHLGVETLVRTFGRTGRLLCMLITNLIILLCAAVFFWGTWKQADINASVIAPVVGISMFWVYGIGFFTSIGIGLIAALRITRLITGRVTEEEISAFAGEQAQAITVRERAE
jgi:TRAP-type C4-dicarboxylate transport system permease small subunit